MDTQLLFQSIARAGSASEVFDLLDEYAEDLGLDGHEQLPLRAVGDQDNNRGLIEALASVDAAGFEKVMNGHDAVIDLWLQEDRFTTNPQTPAESLAEIASAEDPTTWVITSKDKSPTGPGRPPKRANVTIVDQGIGITATRFGDTIMSLQGSNKITDRRFAGSFGYGGSTLYRFSDITLIYSRDRHNPNEVAYTVVFRIQKAGWKSYTYHWLHDGDGNALTANVGEIPSGLLADPAQLDAANVIDWSNNRIILPNAHGTAIKVFGLNAFTDQGVIYNSLRTLGFGIPARVGIRHGIPSASDELDEADEDDDLAGGRRRIYNVQGLRFGLNEPRPKSAHPVLHHQVPIPIMNGQAKLECWILGESARKRTTDRPKAGTVVQRVLGSKEDVTSPIFVTLNGQAHATLPTAVLLRRAGLPYLAGNLIIEINCDPMDAWQRGINFASNREHVTDTMREDLKAEIEKYLREVGSEDGPLGKLNKHFRDNLLATAVSPESMRAGVERFARMINSTVAGAVFSLVGRNHSKLVGRGKVQTLGGRQQNGGKRAQIVLQAVPDWLEVRKSSIQQGESEYITVRTNALNDFCDCLTLNLPDFIAFIGNEDGDVAVPTIALKDGRASYYVKCDSDTPLGTVGTITATLDRSRLNLPPLVDSVNVVVVRRERTEPRMKPRADDGSEAKGLPELNTIMVRPADPNWSGIQPDGLDPDHVAYFAVPNDAAGVVDIFINAEFPALTHVANEAQRRFRDTAIVERLRDDYQFAIKLAVLASLEDKIDELFGETQGTAKIHKVNAAGAKVFAMATWEGLDRLGRSAAKELAA
jgi:hypothetical protein